MNQNSRTNFSPDSPYRRLAAALDALPNRYPPAEDESDLYLLAKIFTPEEAALAALLKPVMETPAEISERLGLEMRPTTLLLKEMAKKGLIQLGKTEQGRLGFGIMPFVVGIYEAQIGRIDAEMAQLFEDYYQKSFGKSLNIQPQVHRVIPVKESIPNTMEIHPYESVTDLITQAGSWGVIDCICRTQQALIGNPCEHPLDVCMVLSEKPQAFDNNSTIRALSFEEAQNTLQRAANAGLVHCVSNQQEAIWYICNCCTCSCAILRGMAEIGVANAVASSSFINTVNPDLCLACGTCVPLCQFNALELNDVITVNEIRCVGCGVCVPVCPEEALHLIRRENELIPPKYETDWQQARTAH